MSSQYSAKRESIRAAASALLAERGGTPAFTLDDVAARAGTTKATIYRYFEGKTALLAEAGHTGEEEAGTRERILDAAVRVIPRLGLESTTMQRIAEEAGVSSPNLYWYFRSKDDLLLAVVERLAQLLSPLAVLGEAPSMEDPRRTISQLVSFGMATQAAHIELLRTIIVEVGNHPELARALYDRVISRVWAGLASYLDAQTALGQFTPGHPLARIIAVIGMVTFYNLVRRNFGDYAQLPSPEEAAREFVSIFMGGVQNGSNRS